METSSTSVSVTNSVSVSVVWLGSMKSTLSSARFSTIVIEIARIWHRVPKRKGRVDDAWYRGFFGRLLGLPCGAAPLHHPRPHHRHRARSLCELRVRLGQR